MTQMLLFESVTENASPVVVPIVPVVSKKTTRVETAIHTTVAAGKRVDGKREDGGLNHMGDLARLVLLRYDLVAKRRERFAARNRAK